MDAVADWFRWLNQAHGINLSPFYDAYDGWRFVGGLLTTVWLSAIAIVASIALGIFGAWLQGSPRAGVRRCVAAYVQFFRNTPPLVQLYFFYFAVGGALPRLTDAHGAQVPPIGSFAWAAITLSLFAGAINVEIFRAGLEAVPRTMVEAAKALGLSRFGIFRHVVLPLALRISLPSLTNNLVNLVKTTTLAYAIGVPELLYASAQIWSEEFNVRETMTIMLIAYIGLVGLVVWGMGRWERAWRIPRLRAVTRVSLGAASSSPMSPVKLGALLLLAAPAILGRAEAGPAAISIFGALVQWAPLIFRGFLLNLLVSVLAMAIGTVLGIGLGLLAGSLLAPVRAAAWLVTQFFRNAPWLVLLFYCMFLLPFELHVFGSTLPLPDWSKATIGLALPVMANVAEIVRGAVQSIDYGQWEAAKALSLTRMQTWRLVILPQCVKRMLPPWMSLYAVLTMATPLISVVGVQDAMAMVRAALTSDGRPELLIPMYVMLLAWFFLYCYPIARWTQVLERRYAVLA